jgi:hypothetical protein
MYYCDICKKEFNNDMEEHHLVTESMADNFCGLTERHRLRNSVVLCKSCHIKIHVWYRKKDTQLCDAITNSLGTKIDNKIREIANKHGKQAIEELAEFIWNEIKPPLQNPPEIVKEEWT